MLREYYLETPSLSFNEIAKKMNVTRERVRQIKNKALDKLRRVIVTDLRDKQEIISVNFESITKGKCLKFKQRFKGSLEEGKARNEVKDLASDVAIKTEANLEEIQKRKNPMNLAWGQKKLQARFNQGYSPSPLSIIGTFSRA